MSQTAVVTRLAVRELWMSFRLLMLLVAFVGAGVLVALVPALSGQVFARLAQGVAAATVVCAATAAWSVAVDRTRGRSGWLVTLSVPRATLVVGWFASVALVVLPALVTAAILGWLSAPTASLNVPPGTFAVAIGAIAATAVAAAALGVFVGTILRPLPGALLSATLTAGIGVIAWLAPDTTLAVPGGAYVALANIGGPDVGPALAWRDAGIALLATAVLLGLARVALSRADL